MEEQIENAIAIAWEPTSDPNLKSQAFEFLQQLRADSTAWQACATLFTRTPRRTEVVRLVSLEVVNNAVQTQLLDGNSLAFLKQTLLEYVQRTYGGGSQEQVDPPSLQNKLTQTLTYLFVHLYADGWTSFIDDFLALTTSSNGSQRDNVRGIILYLRILGSVHDEIADAMLSRQGQEGKRNMDLKDLIRQRDMHKIASSWQDLLAQFSRQNDAVLEMTLKVVGKWVSWIDISLVINQNMLNLLFPLIARVNSNKDGKMDIVRDSTVDTFVDIVAKKMKPADKIELITFLNLREVVAELIASPPLRDLQNTPKYDVDLAEAVARLVNTVINDIVRVLDDGQVDNEIRGKAERLLLEFLPYLLRFFSDEYDEVCSMVIPSLTDLLTFLRKVPELPGSYQDMLRPILDAIVRKMRYDETTNWGQEDEQTDEAEFQELRKKLQNLQRSVAAVDQNLYMDALSNLIVSTLRTLEEQGSSVNWRDIDLALHELYLFGELTLPNQTQLGNKPPSEDAAQRLDAMLQTLVQSGIADYPHPAIIVQYMEICNRYCSFFEAHHEYIPRLLEQFVGLVHHDHPRIRLRSWYLLLRVVRQLRAQVGNLAETMLQSLSDLLVIKAEVPGEDADDDMSSDESDHSADAAFAAQLFLYEAVGCISSTNATPADKQAFYARSILDPLFSDMEQNLQRATSGDQQAIFQIHHTIMALGTLAHGFTDTKLGALHKTKQPPPPEVSDQFSRAAEAILIALKQLNSNSEIRAACRFSFSRLLGVLGKAVLPQLPQWIDGLLSESSTKDEMAFFLRLLDQVVHGFKGEIYDVLNLLLTPLLQRILGGLSEPISGTDDEIQLAELRREYLGFLQCIFNNDLHGVFVSESNQGFFETIIDSIITLAQIMAHSNLAASRTAFTILQRMTAAWGGPDIADISDNPSAPTSSPSPSIPGFDSFAIQRFHSVCLKVLFDEQFNPAKDAQSKQVLVEIAYVEQTIYLKTGNMFIQHLQSTLFPNIGTAGDDFLRAMTTSVDRKAFTNYLQNLLKSRR